MPFFSIPTPSVFLSGEIPIFNTVAQRGLGYYPFFPPYYNGRL
jgi:hypothetical protein